jgi:hypothetical protein
VDGDREINRCRRNPQRDGTTAQEVYGAALVAISPSAAAEIATPAETAPRVLGRTGRPRRRSARAPTSRR